MPSPDVTFTVSRFYNRPVHAISIFERVLKEQAVLGRTLHSLIHIYSLGTGIRFRFEFVDSDWLFLPAEKGVRQGRLKDRS